MALIFHFPVSPWHLNNAKEFPNSRLHHRNFIRAKTGLKTTKSHITSTKAKRSATKFAVGKPQLIKHLRINSQSHFVPI